MTSLPVLTLRPVFSSPLSSPVADEPLGRGTKINIYLKDEAMEYADQEKLKASGFAQRRESERDGGRYGAAPHARAPY